MNPWGSWSRSRKAPTLPYPVVVRGPTGGLHYLDPVLNQRPSTLCGFAAGDYRIEYKVPRATCAHCVVTAKQRGLVRGRV